MTLRSAHREDLPGLLTFLLGLAPESRYHRFLGISALDSEHIAPLVPTDPAAGTAVIGELSGRIVALAAYYRAHEEPARAEVAFAVADAFQGRGLGTLLLEELLRLARTERIHTFDAYVLADNCRMMDVLLDSGCVVSCRVEGGVIHVALSVGSAPPSHRDRSTLAPQEHP